MGKGSPDINRRFTQINADYDSPQRRKGRRELNCCLSGEGDKQKLLYCGQQPDQNS